MEYNFLYTADSNYFNHMYLSIYSLLKNNNYPLTIHIIEDGFTKEQMEKLELLLNFYNYAKLKVYSINKIKDIMNQYSIPKWKGTDISNARLFSGEIIDVDRILYIDSDTIVSSSLKDVFNQNNNPISAVREIIVPSHLKDRLEHYYNAGILLIDYKLCHEIDFLKLISDSLDTSIPLIYPDQDLLNIALNERIGTLSPSYNINPTVYYMIFKHPILTGKYLEEHASTFYDRKELVSAYNDPKIYHLLGYLHTRPWIKNNVHPFNKIYDEYTKEIIGVVNKVETDNKMSLILGSSPLFSLLLILLEVLPFQEQLEIKGKIKKIIYRK